MHTRRQFVLQGVGAAAAGAAALPLDTIAQSGPQSAPVLPQQVLRTLMASAEVVTGVRPLRGHYEAYYIYQATQRPAYRVLYRRFAEALSATAGELGLGDFAGADVRARAGILDNLRSRQDFSREFEIPVIQETLAVFARTDAWLALGYASWEGSARGLDEYRRATDAAPR